MSGSHIRAAGQYLFVFALTVLLPACGGGDSDPPAQYTLGGSVSGLAGSGLSLQNNGAGSITIAANGTFTFAGTTSGGAAYAVTIGAQPTSPSQTCSVANGSGTVASGNVTSIAVSCVTNTYSVGGTTSGIVGTGLTLQNNGGGNLALAGNGTFSFAGAVASGGSYNVTVAAQPTNPSQTCAVANATGPVSSANVTNVAVTCTTNSFAVGGAVSGLAGSGLTLRNNGGGDLPLTANGTFAFASPIASGGSYNVTIATQPTNLSQTCVVANATGPVSSANVTNVAVTCTTNSFAVGGAVSGLAGSGLTLRNNGGGDLPLTANGTFAFASPIASGGSYSVTVATQPTNPSQTCTITNDSGAVGAASISNVTAICTTNTYVVGGTAKGLIGSGLELQINGGDDLPVAANGAFNFTSAVESGEAYVVTVKTQPTGPGQTCVLKNAAGTVTNAAITNAVLTCTMPPARFAYVSSGRGAYCYTIDAISGALTGLENTLCATGVLVAVATDPSGRFAYATNSAGNQIYPYSINQATGALTRIPGSELPAGSNPISVAVDPSGQFVYIGNHWSSNVSAYEINPATGAVTEVPGSPFAAGQHPTSVTIDPTGQFLYTANNGSDNVSAFTIDSATGALTPVAGSPFAAGDVAMDVAIDPATKFAFVSSQHTGQIVAFSINGATGALTPVAGSPFVSGGSPIGLAVDPTGQFLYTANNGSNSISAWSINAATGVLTPIAGSPFAQPGNPYGLKAHPSGEFLYVSNNGNGTVATYSIDPATGALTQISESPVPASGNGGAGTYSIAIGQ